MPHQDIKIGIGIDEIPGISGLDRKLERPAMEKIIVQLIMELGIPARKIRDRRIQRKEEGGDKQ